MNPVLPPATATKPVQSSALVLHLQPTAPHKGLHRINGHQVRLARIAAIDFYPATPTNHHPEA